MTWDDIYEMMREQTARIQDLTRLLNLATSMQHDINNIAKHCIKEAKEKEQK